MSGPISVTTVTADSKPDDNYRQHSITITLNFDTINLPHVDLNVVEKMLAESRWDEGRYPFYEEMLHVGVSKLIHGAVYDAVLQRMHKQYGNETVQTDPNTQQGRAYLEAGKAMTGFHVGLIDSIKKAEIGRPVKE